MYFSKGCVDFNFQSLYVSVLTTYSANFIETTDIVQQIKQSEL